MHPRRRRNAAPQPASRWMKTIITASKACSPNGRMRPPAPWNSAAARPPKPAAASKSYRVLLPSGGDAMAQLGELSDKGFGGTSDQGEISVGVVGSKSAAQVLVSRLATAGFSGAYVAEQQESAKGTCRQQLGRVADAGVVYVGGRQSRQRHSSRGGRLWQAEPHRVQIIGARNSCNPGCRLRFSAGCSKRVMVISV